MKLLNKINITKVWKLTDCTFCMLLAFLNLLLQESKSSLKIQN